MRTQPGKIPESLDFEHSKKRSVFSQVKSLVTAPSGVALRHFYFYFFPLLLPTSYSTHPSTFPKKQKRRPEKTFLVEKERTTQGGEE